MEIGISSVALITSIGPLFVVCEFGERVDNHFNAFHDEFCQCDWYLFPIKMQRMVIIFLGTTQQPAIIQGYGNITLTRADFKKVKTKTENQMRNSNFETSYVIFF